MTIVMPVQSEQKCFGAFFASVTDELPPEDVPGGPLLSVSDPAVVGSMLEASGFTGVVAAKRVKPIRLENIDLLLKAG